MTYNFYFDESFHSRRISSSSLNDNDYFNSYISIGIGFKEYMHDKIRKKYMNFEKKQKDIFGFNCETDELKSKTVSKKHYKYGLASFNVNEVNLYQDYFEFLLNNNILYYFSSCDKLEYLLLQCDYNSSKMFNIYACIYSIVKMINVYRPKNVIMDILNNSTNLISDLKQFCKSQIKANGSLKLKELENEAFSNIVLFLEEMDSSNINYDFNYDFTYRGFSLFLNELGIKNTNVFIDQEGTNKIVESAKKFDFKNVIPNDSKDSFGIRVSDMICGFISKMMRALYDDTKNDPSVPYTTQHLLNSEWFHVNNYQFKLYKTIAKYIKKYNDIYYGSYISLYCDLFSELMGLIYFFDGFNSYEEYIKTDYKERAKEGNDIILQRVLNDIKRVEIIY